MYFFLYLICVTSALPLPFLNFEHYSLRDLIDDDEGPKHHNYVAMTRFLDEISREYPKITHKYSIGKSVKGRELWVMIVSDNPAKHEILEPEFKYVANMHGNEVVGRELLLKLIELLCRGYGKSSRLTRLVDETRMHFMPSMNPDGYELAYKDGGVDWLLGRNNANDVDLNRNFPDQFFPHDNKPREPETNITMAWILRHPFVLSANLHGGSLVANYPFDDNPSGQTEYTPSPDDDVFKALALTYSYAHPYMHWDDPPWECKGVPPDHFKQGITNGAKWYNVAGGMQDFNYVEADTMEITLELGCNKFPDAKDLPRYWKENKEALVKFIEQIHKGIKGIVLTEAGQPVDGAEIHVDDRSKFMKSQKGGDFWRILLPGKYDIKVTKKGFKPSIKTIEVEETIPTIVNFTLTEEKECWDKDNCQQVPALDPMETNNQRILSFLQRGLFSQQEQDLEQRLFSNNAPQPWQSDLQSFTGIDMNEASSETRPSLSSLQLQLKNIDDLAMSPSYEQQYDDLNHMMDTINLKHQEYLSEYTGDEA
ncbi:carboxypeptidase D [Hydra vulgaris]|uniref:Carboxypeptidase D n=1 Tax=Hydra vulgaris TaxID=6087 RepID=A0ABM4CZF8_HYDVU